MELVRPPESAGQPAVDGYAEPILFGVVLPVHDEEELVPAALASIGRAIAAVSDHSITVGIAIVLDACRDRSAQLVADWRDERVQRVQRVQRGRSELIEIVTTEARSVGLARKLGYAALLRMWAHHSPEAIWLATTDADSEVPHDWISTQVRMRGEGGHLWVGPVGVRDWSSRAAGTAEAWHHEYERECLPIHGANLGIDAATYLAAGGFTALSTGEDRDLVDRAVALGAVIRHDPKVRVVTSSRRVARAPGGFAHALTFIEATTSGQPELSAS